MSTPAPDRPVHDAQPADAKWLFGLFSFLFALSLIVHQLWWGGFEVLSPHFVVIVAALWSALRPTSVVRFLAMIGAEAFSVALDMPDVGSHTLLVLVSTACVLAYAGWATVQRRRLPDASTLFERMAPFLRVQLLLVYAVAAIAKLNTGFFDAEASCAVALSNQVAWFAPSLLDGSWRAAPAIWGTVLIEAALPLLLAVPRTRLLGLALGGAFHAVLALAGNVPFSALALALYVAFLPADAPSRLRALAADRPRLGRWARRAQRWGRYRHALPVAVAAWLAAAVVFSLEPAAGRALIANGTRLLLVSLVLAGGTVFVLCLARGGPCIYAARFLRLGHPVFAVGILLLAANALSPYLGLKTESSFTMFSNLQTEAGQWNHLLIPEAVRVFAYQDQLVRVTDSNDPALARRGRDGTRVVRYELERYLRVNPGTSATYATLASSSGRTAAGEADATPLATSILDRVVKFRPVRPHGRAGC